MKKDWIIFLVLALASLMVYNRAFFNFFAQDDFILINHFSGDNLLQDIKNVFGPPTVTHWRPIHNLYFLIAGNLFGKNYIGYHILTFLIHVSSGFLIYKVMFKLIKNWQIGLISGLIYSIHSAHFVSLFWISGGATVIGFFFLISAMQSFLLGKVIWTIFLYILALLASEAMTVGVVLFYFFQTLKQRGNPVRDPFLNMTAAISVVFAIARFTVLTSKTTFDVYQIEFSTRIFGAIKYYFLRIAGFAEISGDYWATLALLLFLSSIAFVGSRNLDKKNIPLWILSATIMGVGLLPFVLVPSHLSPHYMNMSIFGFSFWVGLALKKIRPAWLLAIFLIFGAITISNVDQTRDNNWVVKRSNLAKAYIDKIEKENPVYGSTLIFRDNDLSTSQEAYISLGTGEAIEFWFGDKNYKTCFTGFEKCENLD